MADNTTLPPTGTGTADIIVATDKIGGIDYQRTKVVWGADGTATDASLSANAGLPAQLVPGTTGGLSVSHLVAAGSGDATNAKASAGQIYVIEMFNKGTVPAYLKLHNNASAPTPGTGVVATFGVQAGVGRTINFPQGYALGTGIGFALVTGIADNDSTGVTAASVVVDLYYK